ncbi:hypothetical protein LCGC14_1693090, partial [marine sediment metagenome]
FLLAMPPRRRRHWTDAEIHSETLRRVEDIFEALFGLGFAEGTDDEPVDLPLTPEGKAAWVDFYNAHGAEQAALSGDLAAAWSKLEGYAARLALVIHLARWAGGEIVGPASVDEASMAAGIALVDWYKVEARRVYGALKESAEQREARELYDFVRDQGGRMTTRELTRHRRRYKTSDEAREALDRVCETYGGTWEKVGPSPKGGRPSPVLVLPPPSPVDVDTTPEGAAVVPRTKVLSMSTPSEHAEREVVTL